MMLVHPRGVLEAPSLFCDTLFLCPVSLAKILSVFHHKACDLGVPLITTHFFSHHHPSQFLSEFMILALMPVSSSLTVSHMAPYVDDFKLR